MRFEKVGSCMNVADVELLFKQINHILDDMVHPNIPMGSSQETPALAHDSAPSVSLRLGQH